MSKTDKTNPYYVKWFYDPNYLTAHHRHEFHDCDLPPKPKPGECKNLHYGSWHDPCFWWPSFHFYRSRWGKCCCKMCRWVWRQPRKDRYNAKRYCRDGWRDEY